MSAKCLGSELDRHFQVMHAICFGRWKHASADVDLDGRQQKQRCCQSCIACLPVCTENLIHVDEVAESPKLSQ